MSNEKNQNENQSQEQNEAQENQEVKVMPVEEAETLTKECCKHADDFLLSLREKFIPLSKEYGEQWAINTYLRMALIPGVYVARQSFSDDVIKEMMPAIEKMILEYKIVTPEEQANEV